MPRRSRVRNGDELAGDAAFDGAGLLAWTAQPGATGYEIARSDTPAFAAGCTVWTTADPSTTDAAVPAPGAVYHYLVRALAPNPGSWGVDSAGTERTVVCAP